ncbi:hypothetical protein HUT16_24350 [Kitasatospora sp. NA04385]|uniref:hypothetical protein n=1 Tax=Kitasatospora sp. NA04385 TaxID=2742135 RepID=UPI001592927D|nr:hypothetical protein [Kitasatospora sp. NA04385]QKW21773.1 hypothetical protein HUT16_24350 [Kitasatospora sp. NA04385]
MGDTGFRGGPGAFAAYGAGQYQQQHPGAAPQVYEPHRLGGGSHLPLIAPHLAPGERVHAVVDVQLSDLLRRVPRRHRPKERDGLIRVLDLLFNAVAVVAEAVEEAVGGFFRNLRRIFRGRGLAGGWESQAGRFAVQVLTGGRAGVRYENRSTTLVFTDHRILLGDTLSQGYDRYGEIPRAQLARIEPRNGSWSSRVEAYFADGSRVALDVSPDSHVRALETLLRGQLPPPRQGN